jgi:putative endonuclease
MGAFAYMLRCADGSPYVGSTTGEDVAPRVDQHNAGAFPGSYTWSRRPVTLIWCEHFGRITDAIAAERRIKGWSRAKKLALADGDWERVRQLAKRRGGRDRD